MTAEVNSQTAGNPIIDHLDLWSSIYVKKATTGRGSNGKLSPYGIHKLRELILELAVRGKLVPQDPNDEPASVLLEKAAAERALLVQKGALKKPKKLPATSGEELPFEIPNTWEWARLPDVCNYMPGKTPSTKNPVYWSENAQGIPWVSIADMDHFGKVTDTSKRVTQEAAEKVFKYEPIPAGSLLMSFKLTVGKIVVLDVDAYHNEAIISISPFKGVVRDYLFKALPTRAQEGNTKRAIMGQTLNATSLSLLLIPVPPFEEQLRIVAKVDELMALCDQLEQQQTDSLQAHQTLVETLLATLVRPTAMDGGSEENAGAIFFEHFDTLFTTEESIDQLKKTILQLAVMGRLVPQDPNDEPVSELLDRASGEKLRLGEKWKYRLTKKEVKVVSVQANLPKTWGLVKINEFAWVKGGKRMPKGTSFSALKTPHIYIRVTDMKNLSVSQEDLQYIDDDLHELLSRYIIEKEDLFVVIVGATIGKVGRVPAELDGAHLTENAAKLMFRHVNQDYMLIALQSGFIKNQFIEKTYEQAQPKLALERIETTLVPMPPLAEQQRIVAKVDELMALCDALKARIQVAQTTQVHLADGVVEQAVA
ncbi:MAG: restriction endonuclease subunit S [Candidatus Thiodiazotropha sp. (ex Myrtea spinifera)]|nr:restriction endonuclease subunit S [Candidatus Thiodiazotropha sp. (ex Myrtea spinifera)]